MPGEKRRRIKMRNKVINAKKWVERLSRSFAWEWFVPSKVTDMTSCPESHHRPPEA